MWEGELTSPVPYDFFLTEAELAERWKCRPNTVRDWRFRHPEKLPPFHKLGGKILFHVSDVLDFERRQRAIAEEQFQKLGGKILFQLSDVMDFERSQRAIAEDEE